MSYSYFGVGLPVGEVRPEVCGAVDPVTEAACTLRTANHMTHVDQSDPGVIVKWARSVDAYSEPPELRGS